MCDNAAGHPPTQPTVWVRTMANGDGHGQALPWHEVFDRRRKDPASAEEWQRWERKSRHDYAAPGMRTFLVGDEPVPDVVPGPDTNWREVSQQAGQGRSVWEWICRRCGSRVTIREDRAGELIEQVRHAGRDTVTLAEIRAIMQTSARLQRTD